MTQVDARGLSCPRPVILLRKALADGPKKCEILVDNPTAKENVSRYGSTAGYRAEASEGDGEYRLTFFKE